MSKKIKFIKKVFAVIISIMLIFIIIRHIGVAINKFKPNGGINESRYIEINNSKQWISIYGNDLDNPVLLYLHGGPGAATSSYDYAFTRKWSDVYTVVTWDQRNCGKSYNKDQDDTQLTYELLMQDGKELTEYLLYYLNKDKLTLLGHSWGSFFGANLVLEFPEYYDAFIGVGQLVDVYENEVAFKEIASEWVKDDDEGKELLDGLTPNNPTIEHYKNKNKIMNKYGYGMFAGGTDYNIFFTKFFNPYYSFNELYLKKYNHSVYNRFLVSEEFDKFSLKNKLEYKIPYYNINGDKDFQTNYLIAQKYFDLINAPKKKIYIMENTTHGLLESKSKHFSIILHEISKMN